MDGCNRSRLAYQIGKYPLKNSFDNVNNSVSLTFVKFGIIAEPLAVLALTADMIGSRSDPGSGAAAHSAPGGK
jgi:hypothetical protein